jgi:hypothetical protein
MPNPASGVFKQLAYKLETTYGTAPGQTTGQALRRVQSTLDLSKDTYSSNEIRTDLQMADFRHGVRSVTGKIGGELSCKTYADFFASALKRDFTAGVSAATVSLTIAGTGPTYTVTRAAGSYLTDGFKTGTVVRLSVGTLNAANISKNLFIVALTATVATVIVLNGSALVAEGPIAGCTVTTIGKRTFVPLTGHTDKSFSFEHWYSDLVQSELFLGCKVSKIGLGLPPTGMATIDLDVMGQDMADTLTKRGSVAATSQYFTSPTANTTTGAMSAVNGVVRVGGVTVATLTGLSIDIDANYSGDPVVGSNIKPFMYAGRVLVTGQATAYFDSITMRDAFVNETEIELLAAFTSDNGAASDFFAISLPRIKLGGSTKDDGEKGLVQTIPFTALLNTAGGTGIATEATTIAIQDSAA